MYSKTRCTVALVETMLALHKKLPQTKTPHETDALKRQIAGTDAAIDALVYELYGLTEDKIRIVEGTVAQPASAGDTQAGAPGPQQHTGETPVLQQPGPVLTDAPATTTEAPGHRKT